LLWEKSHSAAKPSTETFNSRLQTGFFPAQLPFGMHVLVLLPTKYRPLVHENFAV
jgi:hypothetical protein